jgi:NhaA family Na+:H+ antiporter
MTTTLRWIVDHFLLLPIGGLIALVGANLWPEQYFVFARSWAFWVNDIAMAFFFGLIAQEVLEEVMPGGALHQWRRWLLPVVAASGAMTGAALVYLAYVSWSHELVLRNGWPVATAIDVVVVYVLVRAVFGRHPAVPFVLLVAIASNLAGLAFVAARQPFVRWEPEGFVMLAFALFLAFSMRVVSVRSFWPYVLVSGPLVWWSLYVAGLNPALALVPIMPFVPHTRRSMTLFEDRPHTPHASPTHFEHVFMYPVHVVLFLFGLVNAGVLLAGYGTGTWALVAAALVGKPLGLMLGTALAVALGLRLPRGLHWRDVAIVALATCGGFAFALFFATAVFPIGPVLGELKLGAIITGIGVPVAIFAAWRWKIGRFGREHAHAA